MDKLHITADVSGRVGQTLDLFSKVKSRMMECIEENENYHDRVSEFHKECMELEISIDKIQSVLDSDIYKLDSISNFTVSKPLELASFSQVVAELKSRLDKSSITIRHREKNVSSVCEIRDSETQASKNPD